MTHDLTLYQRLPALRSTLRGVMLLLWDVLVRFGLADHFKDWRVSLLEELRDIRRAQAIALYICAHAHIPGPPASRRHVPPNAPLGCMRPRYRHGRRGVWRLVKSGRGLAGRIRAMRDFHRNFDALVARAIARLSRATPRAAYVMTRAPRDACVALACVDARSVDDS